VSVELWRGGLPALALLLTAGCATLSHNSAKAPPACADCPEMAVIEGGSFTMGATVDRGYGQIDGPAHLVRVPAFDLAKREVTLGAFRAFVRDTGYVSRGKCNVYENASTWFIHPDRNWAAPGFAQGENEPVVCVSWRDAQAYIDWLNRRTGRIYRLPSEAEWEYAATRADLGDTATGGPGVTHDLANIGKVDCCGGETGGRDVWIGTAPVGSFPADRLGVHDLRGNVWEWQADCYHQDYGGAPTDGSARRDCPTPGYHAVRGGSYGDAGEFLEPRFRLRGPEDQAYFTVGFRLARTP
jgi:formylglycine-generating enzyme required for sulfatase activity